MTRTLSMKLRVAVKSTTAPLELDNTTLKGLLGHVCKMGVSEVLAVGGGQKDGKRQGTQAIIEKTFHASHCFVRIALP